MKTVSVITLFGLTLGACAGSPPPPVTPDQPPAPPATTVPAPTAPVPTASHTEPPPPPPNDTERPRFTIHVVDVGTGLGILIEGPDFTFVYDAGSNDDTAIGDKNRFVAYLRAAKPSLKKIDHVILSHPHRDHVELLPDVITGYAVSNVWDSGAINPICGYRRFLGALVGAPGTTYHSGRNDAGDQKIDFGKEVCKLSASITLKHGSKAVEGAPTDLGATAKMTFLHVDGVEHGAKFNENSLVTLLDLDGTKILLMGDAEAGGRDDPAKPPKAQSVEGYVLAKFAKEIDADVLIAGHHGSKSSSRKAFIDAVSPKVSVISSGPTKYQTVTLPDAEIVDELKKAGELYRTDIDDGACAKNAKKIGPDNDGQPGGCDNVKIEVTAGKVTATYAKISD